MSITTPFGFTKDLGERLEICEIHIDPLLRVYIGYRQFTSGLSSYYYWKSFDLHESNQAWSQFVGSQNLDFVASLKTYSLKYFSEETISLQHDAIKFYFNDSFARGITYESSTTGSGSGAFLYPESGIGGNYTSVDIGEDSNGNIIPRDGWQDLFDSSTVFSGDTRGITLYGDFERSPFSSWTGTTYIEIKKDKLLGSVYDDSLFGLLDNDELWGRGGSDDLYGGYGNDKLYGETGNDFLYGEQGNDELYGGDGDDYLDGGLGKDLLVGGKGNDTYVIDNPGDRIDDRGASTDVDTVLVPIFLSYTLPTNIEDGELSGKHNSNLTGNALANDLTGNVGNNRLDGGLGSDNIDGGGGHDTLIGGAGNDQITGGLGNDTLIGGLGNDDLVGGTGKDLFRFTSSVITGTSGQGTDEIIDFQRGVDKIQIVKTGFKVGSTAISKVVISNSTNNTFGSGANFHFDTATGDLFFKGQITAIADVLGVTSLSASDFSLI